MAETDVESGKKQRWQAQTPHSPPLNRARAHERTTAQQQSELAGKGGWGGQHPPEPSPHTHTERHGEPQCQAACGLPPPPK